MKVVDKSASKNRRRALKVLSLLQETHPDAHCALHYRNPWELLVATILSAQCTDVRVNQVTPALFQRYPRVHDVAAAELSELEEAVRTTGFFRHKARNILATARLVVAHHGGEVPQTLEELVALPGVGRKTANVILGVAFGAPAMVVDTHVKRLAYRLGWSRHSEPEKIEAELRALLPPLSWTHAGHLLIFHGRRVCKAQRPQCSRCSLQAHCPRRGVSNPG